MKTRYKFVVTAIITVIVLVGGYIAYSLLGTPASFNRSFYASTAPAGEFSYDDYAATLTAYVDDEGMVHYAGLKADHAALDRFVRALAAVTPATYTAWSESEKIAFWTNAYNALTLKAIVDRYPIEADLVRGLAFPANSIRQIPGVWDKLQFLVMGKRMTLNDIEHTTLRGTFKEPRIHVALVCAARSCPPLRNQPYTGEKLDAQFAAQARTFLAHPEKFRIDRDGRTVGLSTIFKWFGGDFAARWTPKEPTGAMAKRDATTRAVLTYVAANLPADDARWIRDESYTVKYLDYDWTLNQRPTAIDMKGSDR